MPTHARAHTRTQSVVWRQEAVLIKLAWYFLLEAKREKKEEGEEGRKEEVNLNSPPPPKKKRGETPTKCWRRQQNKTAALQFRRPRRQKQATSIRKARPPAVSQSRVARDSPADGPLDRVQRCRMEASARSTSRQEGKPCESGDSNKGHGGGGRGRGQK